MVHNINKYIFLTTLYFLIGAKVISEPIKTYNFNGTIDAHNLVENIEILEDTSKSISINNIITNDKFKNRTIHKFSEIYLNYSESDFWIKFKIKNSLNSQQYVVIADNNPRLIYKEFYYLKDDSLINIFLSSNELIKTNNHTINTSYYISQVLLNSLSEYTFYLKVSSEGGPLNIALTAYKPSTFFHNIVSKNLIHGIYYGVLLTILFITFLLWFSNKKSKTERYNLWFFFYVILVLIFSLIFDGYGIQYVWKANLIRNNHLTLASLLLSFIFITLFIDNYFNVGKKWKKWKPVLNSIIISSLFVTGLFLLNIVNNKTAIILTFIIAYMLIISSFILALKNYKNTPRFVLFFLSSIIIIVICISILFIHIQSGYLNTDFQDNIIKIGFSFFLILLTIGLTIRMRIQRESSYILALEDLRKMKLHEEKAKQVLESKVQERTKLLLENKNKLEKANKAFIKQHKDLEAAFKKSSRQHVKLQKALLKINEHKDSLEIAFKKSSSQHVKLQKALRLINEQKVKLEKANKEIKESSRLKEIFLANTSHEIRTPLNAIVGFTNLLLKTNLKEDQLKYIKNIKTSGDNLLVIINDILDFSKIEAGKLTFEQINFNIYELINNLIETLKIKANNKELKLKCSIDKEIDKVLLGDPYRLNQILINLIGNSIKFTKKGGTIQLRLTLLQKDNNNIRIKFNVSDTGIGISKDKLHNIFDSFTQAESNTTRKFGGTGLGLAIVKQLVDLQNGSLTVESEIDKGTDFYFELNFLIGSKVNEEEYSTGKVSSTNEKINEIKILLVEDNEINQQLALDTIKNWNKKIEVDVAANGLIATNKLKKKDYHIILMDIQMPEMDGIEATKIIRQEFKEPKSSIPIIAMTAHAMKEERETCKKIGMNDYITKPFYPEDLYRKIIYYTFKAKKANNNITETYSSNNEYITNSITSFEIINLEHLENIYQGNTAKIKSLLEIYIETVSKEIKNLENSFSNSNWAKFRTVAHTLKPIMGYIGLLKTMKMLEGLEKSKLNKEELDNIKVNISEITYTWEKAKLEINKYIDSLNETN
ncbi:MAG: response regulator [Chlorobi bacterium]|nr:response regulator [Chlorobiota bacterium]